LNPSSAECHFNLASAYSDNNQLDLAVDEYKESLKYDNENIDCCFHIAQIQEEEKNLPDAYTYFKKAFGLNTKSDKAHNGMKRLKKHMDENNIKYIE